MLLDTVQASKRRVIPEERMARAQQDMELCKNIVEMLLDHGVSSPQVRAARCLSAMKRFVFFIRPRATVAPKTRQARPRRHSINDCKAARCACRQLALPLPACCRLLCAMGHGRVAP